ncbi:MAG: sugar phosphate nucleotidyltransferase [Eubacteriales bacterium]|nr:sugar phosphate nucleotidyltransferase [Eubacteriales bacterium]
MKKPVLVIMAAGMGSRYGGLKQIDPVDKEGHIIIDFSIYDAIRAGFEKVVFIIKKENEADFKASIGDRMEKQIEVEYVYQDLHNLPEGYEVPEGRVKPFGTGHAILSCIDAIDGPFAVINADDYYGKHAYEMIYQYLCENQDDEKYRYAMVGYILENTLTENGHVARGVCETDEQHHLVGIHERTHIEKRGEETQYTEDDGKTWVTIPQGSTVSMNMWGFTSSILQELKARFPLFLDENLEKNPLKCEYFLPSVVGELLNEGKATVKVLKSQDRWYGVTYKEDKEFVVRAIQNLKDQGLYPQKLWEDKK